MPSNYTTRRTRLGHVLEEEEMILPARRDAQFWRRDGDVVIEVQGVLFKVNQEILVPTNEDGDLLPDVSNPFTRNRVPALFGARGTARDPVRLYFVDVQEMRDYLRIAYAPRGAIVQLRGVTVLQLVNATSLALQLQRRDFTAYAVDAIAELLSRDSADRLRHCTDAEYMALLRLHRRLPMKDLEKDFPFEDDVSQTFAWRVSRQELDIMKAMDFGEELGLRMMQGQVYYEMRKRLDAECLGDDDEEDDDFFSSRRMAHITPIHRERLFVGSLSMNSFWLRTMEHIPALPGADWNAWSNAWQGACVQVCLEKGSADVLTKLEHLRVVLKQRVRPTIWKAAEGVVVGIIDSFRLSLPSHFLGPANEEEEALFFDLSDDESSSSSSSSEEESAGEEDDDEYTVHVSFDASASPAKDYQPYGVDDYDDELSGDEDVFMSSGRIDSDIIMPDVDLRGAQDDYDGFY
ncbi:unnamed protein product [Mycena citricolor]|uniref:Uncharacterized protein n=1 Tax=Mycena citricolor TaxID=2018698 RepID=A0AAD2Q4V2_9AGAR|nr:unnamed protein product [Mycena citricolor]